MNVTLINDTKGVQVLAHALAAPKAADLIRPEHHRPKPTPPVIDEHIGPADLIRPEHHRPKPTPPVIDEHIGPAHYDTGLNPEEGLWIRKGWAGRSH